MKIKLLTFIPKDSIGTLIDLNKGEIYNLDESIAEKLIKENKAEWIF